MDVYPPMSDFLAAEGIPTLERLSRRTHQRRTSIWSSSATRSRAAIPSSRKCSTARFATARCPKPIREHFLWGARSIVIAGTHGKTTTTSLTGWLLTHGGLDPSVLVGGIARNFGDGSSYRLGQGRDFVIEGDEYDSAFFDKTAKFLKYLPDIAVVNNIEFDHADIYADLDAIRLAFRRLVQPRAAKRPVAARRRQPRGARAGGDGGLARARRSARATTPTGRIHDYETVGRLTPVSPRAERSVASDRFELPVLGRTTSATRRRRSPWRPRLASASSGSPRGSGRSPA